MSQCCFLLSSKELETSQSMVVTVVATLGEGLVEGLQFTLPKTLLTPGPSKEEEVLRAGQAIRKLEGLAPHFSITSSTPIEPC